LCAPLNYVQTCKIYTKVVLSFHLSNTLQISPYEWGAAELTTHHAIHMYVGHLCTNAEALFCPFFCLILHT
jgi:hypothetical protein